MSKRARRRRAAQRRPAAGSALVQAAPPAIPVDQTAARPAPLSVSDLQEYRYVITDLRRVGILAAAMFALLILLSLVIR